MLGGSGMIFECWALENIDPIVLGGVHRDVCRMVTRALHEAKSIHLQSMDRYTAERRDGSCDLVMAHGKYDIACGRCSQ